MTDDAAANKQAPGSQSEQYMRLWAESFAQVMNQIAGSPSAMECSSQPPEGVAAKDDDLFFLIAATGSLRGEMTLRLGRATLVSLAQLLLGEKQDGTIEYKQEHSEAAEELLRQVAGHAATSLKAVWGEVQLRVESSSAPSWPPAVEGWLSSATGAVCSVQMQWLLSAALVAGLRPAPEPAGKAENNASEAKLDLLMDVELDVTLRFGGRRMLLREILELGSGSVVELDRELQESADLLLDGRLIARGEVVVVDGSYGLRVTEILSTPPSA